MEPLEAVEETSPINQPGLQKSSLPGFGTPSLPAYGTPNLPGLPIPTHGMKKVQLMLGIIIIVMFIPQIWSS